MMISRGCTSSDVTHLFSIRPTFLDLPIYWLVNDPYTYWVIIMFLYSWLDVNISTHEYTNEGVENTS
jgi:hypothetical protein